MEDYRESEEGKRRFANPEIYQKTVDFQAEMGKAGVAWHNHYSNECTIDFCCCEGDNILGSTYNTYIPSYREVVKQALNELYEKVKHGDPAHQKWLKDQFDSFAYNFQ